MADKDGVEVAGVALLINYLQMLQFPLPVCKTRRSIYEYMDYGQTERKGERERETNRRAGHISMSTRYNDEMHACIHGIWLIHICITYAGYYTRVLASYCEPAAAG